MHDCKFAETIIYKPSIAALCSFANQRKSRQAGLSSLKWSLFSEAKLSTVQRGEVDDEAVD
jgi:hypothetical protein